MVVVSSVLVDVVDSSPVDVLSPVKAVAIASGASDTSPARAE
jgi:hypothetical protein